MQAQGHAQLLVDMIDLGANVQAAEDDGADSGTPRSRLPEARDPALRPRGTELAAMGHTVLSVNGDDMGGSQVIMFQPDTDAAGGRERRDPPSDGSGYYRGSSDFRKDGQAVGW